MSNNISSDIKQPGDPALASVTLLDRVVNELVARRWSAESAAHKNLQVGDRDTQRMWLARAAGLAEAVAVVQMFNEATRSNDSSSATRPTRAFDCNLDAMAGFAAAHG